MLERESRTLTGHTPKHLPAHGTARSLPTRLITYSSNYLRTQLGQQQDDMISKINLLWKIVYEKLDDTPIRNTARSPAAQMNFTNPSSPKHVHFVNSIVILNKEHEAKEEGNVKSRTAEYEDHEMTVESKEEFEEETEEDIEEEEEDSPKHFDTFPTMKELRKVLIKNEEKIFTVRGDGVRIKPDGVASPAMLYLTRRSLEVLKKFRWTTLGGRSNQLSYVSSPLLSKPGEY
ncbi:hypothetical protein Tco_0964461 [Tanacetum coccineum]